MRENTSITYCYMLTCVQNLFGAQLWESSWFIYIYIIYIYIYVYICIYIHIVSRNRNRSQAFGQKWGSPEMTKPLFARKWSKYAVLQCLKWTMNHCLRFKGESQDVLDCHWIVVGGLVSKKEQTDTMNFTCFRLHAFTNCYTSTTHLTHFHFGAHGCHCFIRFYGFAIGYENQG